MIDNNTPYAAEGFCVRDFDGAETWVVVVKATFSIAPDGEVVIAEEQSEICFAPKYVGEPGKSTVLYESDLIPPKPTTDVILNATAYARAGVEVQSMDVDIAVGPVRKALTVVGDRYWERTMLGMSITPPRIFGRMPLVYERAFGGMDQISAERGTAAWERRNPIGTGFGSRVEMLDGLRLPNVEYRDRRISRWEDRPDPAGLCALGSDWSPRLERAGTYDEKWEMHRYPLLPVDFSDRFYLSAPDDQQTAEYLRGGEPVMLAGVTPAGIMGFQLPRVALDLRTTVGNSVVRQHASMDTVVLEPDIPRIIITWRGAYRCHARALELESTTITQKEVVRR